MIIKTSKTAKQQQVALHVISRDLDGRSVDIETLSEALNVLGLNPLAYSKMRQSLVPTRPTRKVRRVAMTAAIKRLNERAVQHWHCGGFSHSINGL